MEGKGGGSSRLLIIFALAAVGFLLFNPFKSESAGEDQPLAAPVSAAKIPLNRPPAQTCTVKGDGFTAEFSTHGASLTRFVLDSARYEVDGVPEDLSTTSTPAAELRRQLRFVWRNNAAKNDVPWLVPYDTLDWTFTQPNPETCVFKYEDPGTTTITKTLRADGAYAVTAAATIENTSSEPKRVALAVETTDWRTNAEVEGKMFRVDPKMTQVECASTEGDVKRLTYDDFAPSDFNDREKFPRNGVDDGTWYQGPAPAAFAGVTNYYFGHAVLPLKGPSRPVCQMQVEYWNFGAKNPNNGAMYRARLAYPAVDVAPGKSLSYEVGSYIGPKNKTLLSAAFGGDDQHHLTELIDLGFFAVIATVMGEILLWIHSNIVGNWGVAIIVLTVVARLILFPLSIPSIRNMIRMRELKPEMDALTEKFKDDPQQKGLAQMELWRKHGVNPLKGCLPQLASMPIWFALYTTLQTAPELYHTPFLWFADLSQPDPYFILPFIIGGTFFVQQKLMPMAGDPTQRKMMLYFMPGMFTVFMLFLPAGLGVYMFTNSLLAIGQQQLVEFHMGRGKKDSSADVEDPETPEGAAKKKRPPKRRARRTRKVS